jgi:exonuclease III
MTSLRILSWNILHGGGKRSHDILEVIKNIQPDIVTLQEFRNGNNSEPLLEGLSQAGLTTQFVPTTKSARENTPIIASRHKFQATVFPQENSKGVHAIHAHLPASENLSHALNLVAVHLPHKKLQLPYFHALLDLSKNHLNENSLLIGDFNCGIPFEDSETKSFYATHLFQELLQKGWIDAWRSRNKNNREFTWISSKKKHGFRYDHALVSPALNHSIQSIEYNHEVRLKKISDHSLLSLEVYLSDS